jgi:alpha-ketoglutarate-dependent taurine dioxygenase
VTGAPARAADPADLVDLVDLVPMQPFGLLIAARPHAPPIRSLPPAWLAALLREHRLVLLRGFAPLPTAEALSDYATTWGELMLWSFGAVLELVEHADPTDHIFDSSCVPYHWDGMYTPRLPAYQLFHCVNAIAASDGGRTIFCDSTRLWADAAPATRARWRQIAVTYTIEKVAHYGGQVTAPLVCAHPVDGSPVLRFNEPPPAGIRFLNRPSLRFEGLRPDEAEAFVEEMRALLYSPRYMYSHEWRTGDFVIADNYVLLHGRTAFTSRAPRHIRRVHILGDPPKTGSDATRPAVLD